MDTKVYVQVSVDFNTDGVMLPRVLIWEDGEKHVVDRVFDIRQAAARKLDDHSVLLFSKNYWINLRINFR